MRYFSTRSHAQDAHLSSKTFSEILLSGLATDGGLFLPEHYPTVSLEELESWRSLSYAQLAAAILKKFISDMPAADIEALCAQTYTPQIYCNVRAQQDPQQITPIHWLGEEKGTRLGLLCLSNGPTLAFKDMAMQLLGRLFEYALSKNQQALNIVGATSGDTGSSAEYALRGRQGVRVFMLSPYKKMSPFQTAQMFSLQDPNIFNLSVEGVFDDCQDIVKGISNDLDFKAAHRIGTVNSINWARVLAQVVYYFKGYLEATGPNIQMGTTQYVSFTVPSGNFGNVCAGHIARMMGLPIAQLVVATNENNVLDEFFRTGIYRVRTAAQTRHTSSPSMDISKASNFERFIADLFARDGRQVKALFQQVEREGGFDISATPEFARLKEYGFVSGSSRHADRINTIRDIAIRYQLTIDPHTADGIYVARDYLQAGVPMLVLETALPAKFSETIVEALGCEPERPAAYQALETLPQRFTVLPAKLEQIKDFIAQHI